MSEIPSVPGTEPGQILRGKRVMICEDEGIVQLHLEKVLRKQGMAVVGTTRFGDVCADTVVRERPDIVLMDISLESSDGWEASRQILAKYSPCIIMVTGQPRAEIELRRKDVPVHGYIAKPIAGDELVRKIGQCYSEHLVSRDLERN